jgi:hypothetical protein
MMHQRGQAIGFMNRNSTTSKLLKYPPKSAGILLIKNGLSISTNTYNIGSSSVSGLVFISNSIIPQEQLNSFIRVFIL